MFILKSLSLTTLVIVFAFFTDLKWSDSTQRNKNTEFIT